MSTESKLTPKELQARAAHVLRAVKAYRKVTDREIAICTGWSRAKVASIMENRTALNVETMTILGVVLGFDPRLFFKTPEDALRWVLDNSPNPV